jgi:hypothetical protein
MAALREENFLAYPIIGPIVALMALTFIVWAFMYFQRLRFLAANHIAPKRVATPELMSSVLPEHINRPSNNLKNLFELPVIFYVVCTASLALSKDDVLLTGLAWAYVLLRAAHSAIHCSTNIVQYRFAAYFVSSLVLWAMVVRLAALAL